jgi:hypothetical protein
LREEITYLLQYQNWWEKKKKKILLQLHKSLRDFSAFYPKKKEGKEE